MTNDDVRVLALRTILRDIVKAAGNAGWLDPLRAVAEAAISDTLLAAEAQRDALRRTYQRDVGMLVGVLAKRAGGELRITAAELAEVKAGALEATTEGLRQDRVYRFHDATELKARDAALDAQIDELVEKLPPRRKD